MSREERVVRPYHGVDRIQHAMDSFGLQVGPDHLEAGSSFQLTPQAFLTAAVHLVFARDAETLGEVTANLLDGIDQIGLFPSEVELLLVTSTSRLKFADLTWRTSFEHLASLETHLQIANADPSSRPRTLLTPFGGCRLDLYACLSCDVEEVPLRPWRKGTWLGHVQFRLDTELGEIGFTPEPLDDEVRKRLLLPKETILFAEIDDPFDPARADESLRYYVDERLLSEMAMNPSTSGAKSFQRHIFVDAMAAVVHRASRSDEIGTLSIADIEGSLVDRLIDRAAGRRGSASEDERAKKKDQLLDEIRNQPEHFVARVQSWVGKDYQRDLSVSIMGGDT